MCVRYRLTGVRVQFSLFVNLHIVRFVDAMSELLTNPYNCIFVGGR